MNCLITLMSDFGLRDPYVGVMKGVIAAINSSVVTIDLTHHIPPQDVAAARFAWMTSVPYFPIGTVHLGVVDPGVGSQRRAIALAIGIDAAKPDAFLVAPDNGLASGILARYPVIQAVTLNKPCYWRDANPSRTFHGRDIFAPIAAHLASGVPLTEVGQSIAPETLISLDLPRVTPTIVNGTVELAGYIQAVDHFGNGITNVSEEALRDAARSRPGFWFIQLPGQRILGGRTYSEVPIGQAVAIVGSHGFVEIAVNGGSAQATLKLEVGSLVTVVVPSELPPDEPLEPGA